ncbi:hypothetical protein [Bosea sp. TAF32]
MAGIGIYPRVADLRHDELGHLDRQIVEEVLEAFSFEGAINPTPESKRE